jgi:NitT/TauT family transport system substrate-binding protein
MFNHVVKAHGLDPSAIQMVAIGTAASAAAALERGMVDLGLIAGTTISILERRHPGLTYLMDTRTSEGTREQLGISEFPMSLLYAKSDWLDENADAALRVTRSIRRTTEWIRTHPPAEIREKLPESYRTDREADLEALRFTIPMLPEDGKIHPETVKAAWDVLATTNGETGPASLKLEDIYTNRFLQ